ncbi:Integrase catalytic domain-containing protein, partial [Aphis craccivora]
SKHEDNINAVASNATTFFGFLAADSLVVDYTFLASASFFDSNNSFFNRKPPPKFEIEALFRHVLVYTDTHVRKRTFSESISLLDALKIPDTGSFILFSIAFRCLPVSTRKLFEANSSVDYPTIGKLLDFLRSRVAILEVVGESHKNSASNASSKSTGQFRKGGDYAGKPRFTSLVTSKSNSTCPCCAGSHALTSCARFENWGPDERARWTRDKKLCFNCFSDEHWALKCNAKSSCHNCTRKHHSLLHHMSSSRDRDVRNEPPAAEASLLSLLFLLKNGGWN